MINCLVLVACLSTPTYANLPLLNPAPTVQYRFFRVDSDFGLSTRPVETGPDGNIWFAAGNSNNQSELGRLAPDGSIKYFPVGGSLSLVVALGLGPNGTVTFGLYSGSIGEMKTDGTLEFLYSVPSGAPIVGGPLASDAHGNIFYGTFAGSHIGIARVSSTGHFTVFKCAIRSCSEHYVQGVVRGVDGNFWFTYNYGSPEGAGRMTPGGAFTIFPLNSQYPTGPPVLGSDGNLWFMDNDQGQTAELVDVTPGGVATIHSMPSSFSYTVMGTIASAPGMLWFDSASQIGSFGIHGGFQPFLYPPQTGTAGALAEVAVGGDGNVYADRPPAQIIEVVLQKTHARLLVGGWSARLQ
jgi:streptogramin lyase